MATSTICQRGGRAVAHYINRFGVKQHVHYRRKIILVRLCESGLEVCYIGAERRGKYVVAYALGRKVYALDRREAVFKHLLKRLLHLGIALVTQLRGKPDHRGFADAGFL